MKKRWFILVGCAIVVGVLLFVFSGRKPYRNLEVSDIVSATVHVTPPDRTIPITDIKELVAYLKEIVIYHEDNSYTEYCGQAVIFTLTMADGSQEEIMEYSPFVVMNGIGYQARHEPCAQLNRYANAVFEKTILLQ